ncbi:DUF2167 domain-containing protein [Pelomonas sp. CA6]|uniref:DUF2167 domain-containing protein n=1 Tax=Pelomonas sp. CA6 TaxID=2907999 RepID=UPI001F4C40EA|nr:DUF2167 domain-containing protein [Pelomonas sp. CA6]MCH7345681.1 DUF2167 domain-containing protein [Pelomonas sp. CA6]
MTSRLAALRTLLSLLLGGLLLAALPTARGADAASAPASARDEAQQAFVEAKAAAREGPTDIVLAQQAVLHLPKDRVFIPQPQAARLMRVMGNPGHDDKLLGLIFPQEEGGWFAVLRYEDSGYIKDDDAKTWNADELLKSYREGTEASNAERQKMGVPALEIVGWAESPRYSADSHRLAWAMSSRSKGAPADEEQGVNYNTYALGREGYLSLNLVGDLKDLARGKTEAQSLLGALQFNEGKRYSDFNSSTDKVAEYGLAALVLGVGAKKLGFFALAAAFFAKFAKLIFIALLGLGGLVLKLVRRKPATPAAE